MQPNIWDIVALILVTGAMVLIVYGGEQTTLPLSTLDSAAGGRSTGNLPLYALRTTLRMLLALVCSSSSPSSMRRWPPRAGAPRWC